MTYAPAPEQTPGPQTQGKVKKPIYKRVWFIVLAGLVLIGIGANLGGGAEKTAASASGAGASDAAAPAAPAAGEPVAAAPAAETQAEEEEEGNPGMGEPAADGKFTFVTDAVDCSTTEIGNEYLNKTAQGTYCIVDLTITNTGDKPQSFFGDNAKLLNAEGQEFSADSEAAIYLEDSSSLYEEINPGNTLKSKVVFDVPAGTTPTAIELHDSVFSGGVTVDLQ
ncbi:DUF4352 domain-containing protein [Modestobacter sp. SSW1-42]|uniref:DUF4352 domain-containing protein n=1 Tax=Modestobacter sp. SSW1-42 TaxID=596372 RepID=UPI00398713F7